jgi:hypothetical protein
VLPRIDVSDGGNAHCDRLPAAVLRKPHSQRTGGACGPVSLRFDRHDAAVSLKVREGMAQAHFLLMPFGLAGIPRSHNGGIASARVLLEALFAYPIRPSPLVEAATLGATPVQTREKRTPIHRIRSRPARPNQPSISILPDLMNSRKLIPR